MSKHFGHKVPVAFSPEAGEITLPFGTCELAAQDKVLTPTATSEAETLTKLEKVIADHFAHFALSENLTVTWACSV
ncbi:DUF2218 domain-containing protein [Sulfitobacter sp.]|uniref:DUF2218 domain-containing protein n=1 Tax=Sulfitobacter sp. TaxID=1903071 RepID=UPI003FCDB817